MPTLSASQAPQSFTVPTLPTVLLEIGERIDDPNSGVSDVGAMIAKDPPLAAKVLRIVNSSFYGLPERCYSVERASTILGLQILRNIVTQAAVIQGFERLRGLGFDLDGLWRHAVLTAQVCALLARRSKMPALARPDEMYICGLLHDIGQLVLLDNLGEEYVALCRRAKDKRLPLHALERQELGQSHADVGATVVSTWGFPPTVVTAVQCHHGPRQAVTSTPAVCLVANANLLVERVAAGNLVLAAGTFDGPGLQLLGISTGSVTDAVQYVRDAADSDDP